MCDQDFPFTTDSIACRPTPNRRLNSTVGVPVRASWRISRTELSLSLAEPWRSPRTEVLAPCRAPRDCLSLRTMLAELLAVVLRKRWAGLTQAGLSQR